MSEFERRIYTEKEAARILRRASELKEEQGYQEGPPKGATARELMQLASEVGVEARYIQAALQELHGEEVDPDHLAQVRWLGAPPEYSIERIVPGVLTQEAWQTIVGMLNSEYKQSIEGVINGKFHTWQWKHELGWVHVSAIKGEGNVRIRMNFQIDSGLVAGLIPTVIAWFAAASILFAADSLRPWLSALFSALLLVGLATGYRSWTSSWWKQDKKKSARLMKRLIETAFPTSMADLVSPNSMQEEPSQVQVCTD